MALVEGDRRDDSDGLRRASSGRSLTAEHKLQSLAHALCEATSPEARLSVVAELGNWLHADTPLFSLASKRDFAARNTRVGALLQYVVKDPLFSQSLLDFLSSALERSSLLHLLAASGLPREHGFYGDLMERFFSLVLPQPPRPSRLSDLLGRLFPRADDEQWIQSWGAAELAALSPLASDSASAHLQERLTLRPEIPLALKALAASLVSCAFSDEVLQRLAAFERGPERFVDLLDAASVLASRIGGTSTPLSAEEGGPVQDAGYLLDLILAARARTQMVLSKLESTGASLPLVYRLERMLAILSRMEHLCLFVSRPGDAAALQALVAHLVAGIHADRSVRLLLQRNLGLIARNIVERISDSGETYIARTYEQWRHVLKGAAGGGALTSLTGAIKLFLSATPMPPLISGLAHGLNYSVSFVLMQMFSFKLATKQPAFFAGAIAAKIDRTNHQMASLGSEALVNEIRYITRSQTATIIGNIVCVVPACLLFDWMWAVARGHSFLDRAESSKVFESLHPLTSGTIWYAALTGLVLFVSSLAGSWLQNFLNNRGVPEGVFHSSWLSRILGRERTEALALQLSRSAGGVGTSVALGFMLGFVPVLGLITGLPLDVRHVTLSMAQLTLAIASAGLLGFEWSTTLWGLGGILVIGVANFAISFALGLWLALRARGLYFPAALRILRVAASEFAKKPFLFLMPMRRKS